MKAIIKTILITLLAFSIQSCKKYPEGPNLSLKSKTSRLTNKWKIEQGSTTYFGSIGPTIYSYEFTKGGTFTFEVEKDTSNNQLIEGTWKFYDNKSSIITYLPSFTWRKITFLEANDTILIDRLTKKEFWFNSWNQGTKYLTPFE